MTTETIVKELQTVNEAAAETIDSSKPIKIHEHTLSAGQGIPQGDVMLIKLDAIPKGWEEVKNFDLQIAEGNTQGSRHIWDSPQGIKAYRIPDGFTLPNQKADLLFGLAYELSEPRTLTHPEHAHHTYHKGFVGATVYQRAFAEELRRIQD